MSRTVAFKVFLTAELLKLRNPDMAETFFKSILDDDLVFLTGCGLSDRPGDYGFSGGCEEVGRLLDTIQDKDIGLLARLMSGVRGNHVYSRVVTYEKWGLAYGVDMRNVSLSPAEAEVNAIFERSCHKVLLVASDPELWTVKPYSEWEPRTQVEYKTCLATRFSRGRFQLIDGTHRALQMAKNGETTIDLCCPTT